MLWKFEVSETIFTGSESLLNRILLLQLSQIAATYYENDVINL